MTRLRKATLVLLLAALATAFAAPAAHAGIPWIDGDSTWTDPPAATGNPWIDAASFLWSWAVAATGGAELDRGSGVDPDGLSATHAEAGAGIDPIGESADRGPDIDPNG